jgi:uncharacterized protein (TIGR02391 family)
MVYTSGFVLLGSNATMRVIYIHQICPDPDELLSLDVPEAAQILLQHLVTRADIAVESIGLRKANFFGGPSNPAFEYSRLNSSDGRNTQRITELLTKAWEWLVDRHLLIPKLGYGSDWVCVSDQGRNMLSEGGGFERYLHSGLLRRKALHPSLAAAAYSAFMRGDYDIAIFSAFRAVENNVRCACSFENSEVGVALMRKAFNPDQGPLSDKRRVPAEREAMMHVFAGAMGLFKNPTSHREKAFETPEEAVPLLHLADFLLKKIDELSELNGLAQRIIG